MINKYNNKDINLYIKYIVDEKVRFGYVIKTIIVLDEVLAYCIKDKNNNYDIVFVKDVEVKELTDEEAMLEMI